MSNITNGEFRDMIKKGCRFVDKPIKKDGKWDLKMAIPKEFKDEEPIYRYQRYYIKNPESKIEKVLLSIRKEHPYFLKANDYGIILLDVKGFSTKDTLHQINVVNFLYAIISYILVISNYRSKSKPSIITTGDGCYIIYPPAEADVIALMTINYRNAYTLSTEKTSNTLRSLYDENIRICCHIGPAIQLRDITGSVNFIGEGMNDCARLGNVRNAKYPGYDEKNDIIVSDKAYKRLEIFRKANCPIAPWPFNFKDDGKNQTYVDKHGKEHLFKILYPITKDIMFMRLPKSDAWMLGSGWNKG